jgi:hypothetical protein
MSVVGTGVWRVQLQDANQAQTALVTASSIQDVCIKAVRWATDELKLKDVQVTVAEFIGTIDA